MIDEHAGASDKRIPSFCCAAFEEIVFTGNVGFCYEIAFLGAEGGECLLAELQRLGLAQTEGPEFHGVVVGRGVAVVVVVSVVHQAGIAPYGTSAVLVSEFEQSAAVVTVGIIQVHKPQGVAVLMAERPDPCEDLLESTIIEVLREFGRNGV